MVTEDQSMYRRVRFTVGLGLPMLKQLGDRKTDVSCNLPKKDRRDIATSVERYRCCAACAITKLLVRTALAYVNKAQALKTATTSAALRTGTLPTT